MLVRTWNLFHGNTVPPSRVAYLEEMVRLVTTDGPGVVCLQELPAWALEEVEGWTDMAAYGELAAPPRVGPVRSTAQVGRVLTSLHPGLLRSAFSGQGNAILLDPTFETEDYHALVLNTWRFRRDQARRLGLGTLARLAWAKERRVCQALRAVLPDGRRALLANLHATAYAPDRRLADAELRRAAEFVLALGQPGQIEVIAGDFNVFARGSETIAFLRQLGFSQPGRGVDHILVRGAGAGEPIRWTNERRARDGRLLSDHAPLEVEVE